MLLLILFAHPAWDYCQKKPKCLSIEHSTFEYVNWINNLKMVLTRSHLMPACTYAYDSTEKVTSMN